MPATTPPVRPDPGHAVEVQITPDGRQVRVVFRRGIELTMCNLDAAAARQIAGWLVQGAEHVERAGVNP